METGYTSRESGELDGHTVRKLGGTVPSAVGTPDIDKAFIRRVVAAAGYVVETRGTPDDAWQRAGAFACADQAEAFELALPGQYPLHKRVRMVGAPA